MESKHEAKGSSDSKADDEGQSELQTQPPKNIVMKFSEYAFKVLNQDMDDFFEDNMSEFDQDSEELTSGQGETLQQYDVYQQYIAQLEKHFDSFAADEGFDSVLDCFNALNDLVIEDKLEREKAMKDMARRMKEMQDTWQKKLLSGNEDQSDSKAEGKDDDADSKGADRRDSKGGDNDDDTKADSKAGAEEDVVMEQEAPPPVVMFFQPVSMDSMLSHVLSMTEYSTFSAIMRTKVRQAKLLALMERRVASHEEDAEARTELLEEGRRQGLISVYGQLVDRVCGLTPHQHELQLEVRSQLGEQDWADMLSSAEDDAFPAKYKQVFKRLVMSVCMAIWNMVSLAAQQQVRLELCRFIPQIDQLEANEEVVAAARGFLAIGHSLVDDTERNMVEVLQAHSHHHRKRKAAEGRAEAK
mmetsp:Transcript_12867/g.21007  ORF Transcript_12867/g.21007 Transcript_12867/m.21007 type:complete len:414 (+) Transcript_12867:71-1312(+)|eukprot:CAMPEP_0114419332 /NCGR_PEP_ID=MMETSP0103-20121206/3967_1 /TAXON_ID=37642 ORGANISM="Paraphysomonas imperforata, Strain PA2" /NCGR_SAMPLE_ID=MMETSP0103 /ASSEMBLY_ACC=CAM_ASM_000201 /LENGTH=413 /DNA_ID=CAMNT_0001587737 /DNA_START=43 /DNA_END=1284 /DNA_ORIENTATION=+